MGEAQAQTRRVVPGTNSPPLPIVEKWGARISSRFGMLNQTIQSSITLREGTVNAADTEGSRCRLIAAGMVYLLSGTLCAFGKAIPVIELHHDPTRPAQERRGRAAQGSKRHRGFDATDRVDVRLTRYHLLCEWEENNHQ